MAREEASHPFSFNGVAPQGPLGVTSNLGEDTVWLGRGVAIWKGLRAQVPQGQKDEEPVGQICAEQKILGEMFSRVDKDAFHRRRWKGVTKTPQSLGQLA